MFLRFKIYAAALGAALMAVLGALAVGRRQGKQRAAERELRERLDAAKKANEVRDDVGKMDSGSVNDGLAEWMRDDDAKL